MAKSDIVKIASRALSIYFLVSALTFATYLPQYVHSLMHYLGQQSALVQRDYWTDYYILETGFMLVRIALQILATVFFWNGGPQVMRIFSVAEPKTEDQTSST